MTAQALTQHEQSAGYGTKLPDSEYQKLGDKMQLEARLEIFLFTILCVWDRYPQENKKRIANFAGFIGVSEKLLLRTPWLKLPPVNQNLIANAVIQMRVDSDLFTDFAREVVL